MMLPTLDPLHLKHKIKIAYILYYITTIYPKI